DKLPRGALDLGLRVAGAMQVARQVIRSERLAHKDPARGGIDLRGILEGVARDALVDHVPVGDPIVGEHTHTPDHNEKTTPPKPDAQVGSPEPAADANRQPKPPSELSTEMRRMNSLRPCP